MAERPIFIPLYEGELLVEEILIIFKFHAGFSIQQKQKSIVSLHETAHVRGLDPILEISTKSLSELGRGLSALNLSFEYLEGRKTSVEALYQGSKVFERGGPFIDIYSVPQRNIKRDDRLQNSGNLVGFEFANERWDLEPKTAFYDWLYLKALDANPRLAEQLAQFKGFSDIEFNPKKSLSCQARSAALFVALKKRNLLQVALSTRSAFIEINNQGTAQ